jgi:hypothetical protein
MRRGYHVLLLSEDTGILGEVGMKNCFGLIAEVPSLPTDFSLNCSAFSASAEGNMWYYAVTTPES